ncbi:MAG: hypothetical protein M0R17_03350 [Candidatus Omnitrophica bacterium]|jgi:hypothetical protein|nr:hypothetical protein [Candidatus Omnitrophota bacterium]
MECVVQVVRGNSLDITSKTCMFCDEPAQAYFCITGKLKHDGISIQGYEVCNKHLERINALLSGEFEIDNIYLEKYRNKSGKILNLRGYPPIHIRPTKNQKRLKICKFVGCINTFMGIGTKKYCDDIRCIEARQLYNKSIPRSVLSDPDGKNIILSIKYKKRLHNGQSLKIRCHALNKLNNRCSNTFLITYDSRQSVYPQFCECHRSAFKRKMFQQKG